MRSRSANLPLFCAAATILLAGLPFGAQQLIPALAVPLATLSGVVFVVVGFRWKQVVSWLYGGRFAATTASPTLAQSVDQRIWRFFMKTAYPAFVLLGVSLPAKFLLEGDPMSQTTVKLSGLGLVVVVLAWFAPLFVDD